MNRRARALLAATALATGGCGRLNPFRKPPVETIALGGTGMVSLSAGMFVLMAGRSACRDVPFDQECSADDTHNVLAASFIASGFALWMIAGTVMYLKDR